MEKLKNIPSLRFPEYSGDWEDKKLGTIAKFSKGKGISKSDISTDGINECIRYGELYTRYGEVIKEVYSRTNIEVNKSVVSEANDVIIPASGETQIDIATASCVIKSGIILGGDLNIIKTDNNGVFLSYYLNNKKKQDIANLAQGISVVHLYSSQLALLNLNLPEKEEQTKIASFLTKVDEKLTALKKKKELLEQYKKGVLQEIFSQELRFKDENGDDYPEWELKNLGDVAEKRIVKNKDNKIKLVFTNSAIQGIVNQRDFFDKDIANHNNLMGYYIIEKNDFVYNPRISSMAPVGPISRNHLGDGIMSPLYSVFRFKVGNINFFEKFFASTIWYKHMENISNYGARDDRMSFSSADFYKMPIPLPCAEEQDKIANFLSTIDNKISYCHSQIEKNEVWKKGLLQQMFC